MECICPQAGLLRIVDMNKTLVAKELLAIGRMIAMDFPTQEAYEKYMKEHPDADRSKHRVVKYDPSKPETHPMNLMQQRKNEQKMREIGKALGKKPEDLTNDDIVKHNKTKNELQGGLKQWVKDYKEQRKSNPEGAKQTKENIDKIIREKGLHKDLVYARELLAMAKFLVNSNG